MEPDVSDDVKIEIPEILEGKLFKREFNFNRRFWRIEFWKLLLQFNFIPPCILYSYV